MQGVIRKFAADESGAVAGLYAVALIGLIAVGGVGFDYARMAGMDSELQNAADQAALAAATQLDGEDEACARADDAAINLLDNITLLSNDGSGNSITVNSGGAAATGSDQCGNRSYIAFYSSYTDPATFTLSTSDETSKIVAVSVDSRTSRYAFTPIVGAIFATMSARAVASLGSAVCNTPPVMICNPAESTDPNFDDDYKGKGVRLVSVGPGGGWVPGNFGYLKTNPADNGSGGASELRKALGWDKPPNDCIQTDGVDTKPGANVSVTDAINTRFDIYDEGQSCPNGGSCSPSLNSRKDLTKQDDNKCGLAQNDSSGKGWALPPEADQYLPVSTTLLTATSPLPKVMGYPRDVCHAVGNTTAGHCSSPVGSGVWDRNAYFKVNYPSWGWGSWTSNTGLPANASRYQVYKWELDHQGDTIVGEVVLGSRVISGNGGNTRYSYGAAKCVTPGVTPGGLVPDRRKITVAVVNCEASNVQGNSTNVPVVKFIDAFLVEPSVNRKHTHQGDVYIEVIDVTTLGGGGEVGQAVRKDKPYLIE